LIFSEVDDDDDDDDDELFTVFLISCPWFYHYPEPVQWFY